jgi:hypothetical protein
LTALVAGRCVPPDVASALERAAVTRHVVPGADC